MFVHEYGNPDDPTVILLAPMMMSGEDIYHMMSPHFANSYHIIAPDQGGHGDAGAYVSADDECAQLKHYLVKQGITDIELVYGSSLGVAVGWRLFLDNGFNIHHAWFDGVLFRESAPLFEFAFRTMFKQKKRSLSKHSVEASKGLEDKYGHERAVMMTRNFNRITESDIDAICHTCCNYPLAKLTPDQQARLHLDYGSKDPTFRQSRRGIATCMPNVGITIRKGYPHCGYVASHTAEYVREIEEFIQA